MVKCKAKHFRFLCCSVVLFAPCSFLLAFSARVFSFVKPKHQNFQSQTKRAGRERASDGDARKTMDRGDGMGWECNRASISKKKQKKGAPSSHPSLASALTSENSAVHPLSSVQSAFNGPLHDSHVPLFAMQTVFSKKKTKIVTTRKIASYL